METDASKKTHVIMYLFGEKTEVSIAKPLTILSIEEHLVELGFIIIKGLSDFVYRLLVSEVAVHEAAK